MKLSQVIQILGHKKDVTIADLVADYSVITPTEAGKIVVQDKAELLHELDKLENNLKRAFKKFKEIKEQKRKIVEMEGNRRKRKD